MRRKYLTLLAVVGFAAFLSGPSSAVAAATAPPLGTKLPQFGVLGGAAVTGSTGLGTLVNGDVGSSPNPAISNFLASTPPGPSRTVPPYIVHYLNDAVVQQAILDARAAWVDMGTQGAGVGAVTILPQLAGQVLTPGVYNIPAAADISGAGGTLTLNDPTGVGIFIINVGSSLTANVGSIITGSANPCNVYWRMGTGGSATLNGVNFWGTVIADQSVTVSSATTLTGRAVGIIGAVTMPGAGGNTIGGCSIAPGGVCPDITVNPATLPSGALGTPYNQLITAVGSPGPFTYMITGALPNGLLLNGATGAITGTPTTIGVFNFTITATDTSTGCQGSTAYAVVILATLSAVNGPTLGTAGLMILVGLLAVAGMFVINRFSA